MTTMTEKKPENKTALLVALFKKLNEENQTSALTLLKSLSFAQTVIKKSKSNGTNKKQKGA